MSDVDFLGDSAASSNPSVSTQNKDDRNNMRVGASGVKDAFSKKGLFNPGNKKRMIFFGVSGLLLLFGLGYTFMSASPVAPAGGGGDVQGYAHHQRDGDGSTDQRVQDSIRQYNEERLPEVQQENPFAHPLLLANEEVEEEEVVEEEVENPFTERPVEEEEEEVVAVFDGQGTSSSRGYTEQEIELAMGFMEKLVRTELESPRPMSIAWSYNQRPVVEQPEVDNSEVELGEAQPMVCTGKRVRAGTTLFGTTDLAMNSDVGGAVSLTVRSGPLNGYRMLGEFDRRETWLRINLNRVVARDEVVPINAIALDMDTTLNAVSGDVNRHIMYRYGWWGVGALLKAMGKAAELAANNDTIYTEGGHVVKNMSATTNQQMRIALGELGEQMGDQAKQRFNRPITVSLAQNEQIGVFVLDDICVE